MTRPYPHAITCSQGRRGTCYSACACWCHHAPTWPYNDMTRRITPPAMPPAQISEVDVEQIKALFAPTVAIVKRIVQAYVNALRPIARAIHEANNPTPLQLDLREIRRLGDRERRAARAHLDAHVDTIYADLGLERPR